MARVSTYLNFMGNTEEAFEFYRSVFGGKFTTRGGHCGSVVERFGVLRIFNGPS